MAPVSSSGIGHSQVTPDKQYALDRFLALHLEIAKRVLDKNAWTGRKYHYIDTYAGDGEDWEGTPGSTSVFYDLMRHRGVQYEAHFIDIIEANTEKLRSWIFRKEAYRGGNGNGRIHVHTGDCVDVAPGIARQWKGQATRRRTEVLGLVYCDPNGYPDIPMVRDIATTCKRLDILLRVPATALKRNRKAQEARDIAIPNLIDDIRSIDKAHWLIRGPIPGDRWQWIFLFGTNYENYPEWKKHGFVRMASDQGMEVLNKVAYTADELKELNQSHMTMADEMEQVHTAVITRSGGLCELCGAIGNQAHHTSYPTKETPDNLQWVCHPCHCQIHGVKE